MYAADLRHPDRTLQQKLHAIYALSRHAKIDLSFRRPYLDLLQAFRNPHLSLPPVIHVAGTNGKGSIVATLRSILQQSGYRVHSYTSPHLLRFNERITLAGTQIDDAALEALIDEALALNEGRDVTFFELTTAMAFAAFSRVPADVLLLETGLGGRLDCTNIIEKPMACVISKISMDHLQYLGDTLQKIAAEKAGIMKTGATCIIGAQDHEGLAGGVMEVFENRAAELGISLCRAGKEWEAAPDGDRMRFAFNEVESPLPKPSLPGAHQIENAGAALATLTLLKDTLPVTEEAIAAGLRKIEWPGRLERLDGAKNIKPYNLPPGWELWYDGGHNDSAGRVLAEQAKEWQTQDGKMLHLVLGMKTDKDPAAFITPLLPFIKTITLIDVSGVGDCIRIRDIAPLLQSRPTPELLHAVNARAAIDALLRHVPHEPSRILVCGSLYLAEQVY